MRSASARLGRGLLAMGIAVWGAPALGLSPTAAADVPNPPFSGGCPQRIALVLDLSESMNPYLGDVLDSAEDLVDALRDSPNQVSVITFGTVAGVAVTPSDVSDDATRQAVKDRIDGLDPLGGGGGATNWEAALQSAGAQDPDLVVFVTDGFPTAHGSPVTGGTGPEDPEHLAAAVRVADGLRAGGSRIVGLGVALLPATTANLGRISGPVEGVDFHRADATALAARLREIAADACGVPVAALPQPQRPPFPFGPAIGVGVAALLAVLVGGLVAHRRRSADATTAPRAGVASSIPDPTLRTDDLPPLPGAARSRPRRPTEHPD